MNSIIADRFLTKLGFIEISFASAGRLTPPHPPIGGVCFWHLNTPAHAIQLSRCNTDHIIKEGLKVHNNAAWLCEIEKTRHEAEILSIGCCLKASVNVNREIATGENMDCIAIWSRDNSTLLHIATEDGESIKRRAELGKGFPKRLVKNYSLEQPLSSYTSYGLRISLPGLNLNEKLRLYFVTATGRYGSEDSWLAAGIAAHAIDKQMELIMNQ